MTLALTTYDWLKTFHVVGAVAWVGGGAMLTILGLLIRRTADPAEIARFAGRVELLGLRMFTPLSFAVFGLGIALIEEQPFPRWHYDTFFVLYGIVAWGVSAATGALVLGPTSGKISKLVAEKGPADPEAQALIGRVLAVARVDVTILFSIVFFMTLKPFL